MLGSVIIPTFRGAEYIRHVLMSLSKQSLRDFELIAVVKPSGDGTEFMVKKVCENSGLNYHLEIQNEGYFTRALNIGIKAARGKILLFTDDDAILPQDWIEKHVEYHSEHESVGAVSGRFAYYNLRTKELASSELEKPLARIYRRLFRPVLEKPHAIFRDYRHGVYLTSRFKVAAGHFVPYKTCLSLPCRGVNMSFKREAVRGSLFPEHPFLKTAPNNEQYFGIQVVLRGWKSVFYTDSFVYHISRKSISRGPKNSEKKRERRIMEMFFKELIGEADVLPILDWRGNYAKS